jgi:uncharacterized RDD family membrane protein YckC
MRDLYASLRLPPQRVYVKDASLLRRLGAFVADLLLLDFAVFSSFGSLLLGSFDIGQALREGFTLSPAAYAAAVVMALLGLAYFSLFEYVLGQTPGMMLLNIRAVNVTLWRAAVRNAYMVPLFPFPLLWVIEPVHLALRKTRLLEVISRTRTIEYISY